MGRKQLNVPNGPINASVPETLLQRLRTDCGTRTVMIPWRIYITRVLEVGLKAVESDPSLLFANEESTND